MSISIHRTFGDGAYIVSDKPFITIDGVKVMSIYFDALDITVLSKAKDIIRAEKANTRRKRKIKIK